MEELTPKMEDPTNLSASQTYPDPDHQLLLEGEMQVTADCLGEVSKSKTISQTKIAPMKGARNTTEHEVPSIPASPRKMLFKLINKLSY